jgi:hypothetical protein
MLTNFSNANGFLAMNFRVPQEEEQMIMHDQIYSGLIGLIALQVALESRFLKHEVCWTPP